MRRSPLRTKTPLRAKTGLTRRGRIRQQSAKRRAANRRRAEVVAQIAAERGVWCELRTPVCTGRWQHGHELVGRAQGGSITDPDNILLACDRCNGYVEDHPAEARANGWKRRRRAA